MYTILTLIKIVKNINEMAATNSRRTIAIIISQGAASDDIALEQLITDSKAYFIPIAVTEKCSVIEDGRNSRQP